MRQGYRKRKRPVNGGKAELPKRSAYPMQGLEGQKKQGDSVGQVPLDLFTEKPKITKKRGAASDG